MKVRKVNLKPGDVVVVNYAGAPVVRLMAYPFAYANGVTDLTVDVEMVTAGGVGFDWSRSAANRIKEGMRHETST